MAYLSSKTRESGHAQNLNGNRQSAHYQNFGGAGQLQSLQRQFSLSPAHNKVLGVTDTERHANGSQVRKTQALQWDESGKLQSDGQMQFARDAAGRVADIQNGTSHANTSYITNALGQRIRKQTGQKITDTVYGEEAVAPGLQSFALGHYEHRQTNQGTVPTLVSEYIYIPTAQGPMPIAAEINGRLYAVHTDQLNTPRQLTDENGQKVWQWAISGFGEVEPTTAETGWIRARNGSAGQIQNTLPIAFNLRFPGQQFDEETGLHYNHHRYYDPYLTVGYTEADPLGLGAGWNRFAYVDGDPLSHIDPTGEAIFIPGAIVGGIVGGATAAASGQSVVGGVVSGAVGGLLPGSGILVNAIVGGISGIAGYLTDPGCVDDDDSFIDGIIDGAKWGAVSGIVGRSFGFASALQAVRHGASGNNAITRGWLIQSAGGAVYGGLLNYAQSK